jgi:hypothetical protein
MCNGIDGCDMDHDGDIDYVVTKFGLNTKYRASAQESVLLFYGDFEGYGAKEIWRQGRQRFHMNLLGVLCVLGG